MNERASECASKQAIALQETEIENKTRVKMTYIEKLNNKTLCTKPRSNHASTLSINVSIAYHSLERKTPCIPGVNFFVSDFLMYLPKTTNRAHEQTSASKSKHPSKKFEIREKIIKENCMKLEKEIAAESEIERKRNKKTQAQRK